MSYQTRRFNRVDVQVSLLTTLIVVVSCYLIFFINYRLSYGSMVSDLRTRAENVHEYLETYLENGEIFKMYTREDENTEIYREAKLQLKSIRSAVGVRYLYTATVNPEGEFIYGVDGLPADSEDFRHIGDAIEQECIPDMEKAMKGEIVLPQRINTTSWGAVFIAYFPMHSQGEVVGVLGMEFDAQSQYDAFRSMLIWTFVVIMLFCVTASAIAVKMFRHVSNPSLQNMSNTDFLTGVQNRNAFELSLSNMENAQEKRHMALLSADMDHLKYINDTYGHAAGDEYIRFGCQVIQSVLPDSGILYRIGGDEFAVLLRNTSEEEARALTEKILEVLNAENEKDLGTMTAKRSMSVGYAVFDPEKDTSLYDTLKRADKVMYVQKHRKGKAEPGNNAGESAQM